MANYRIHLVAPSALLAIALGGCSHEQTPVTGTAGTAARASESPQPKELKKRCDDALDFALKRHLDTRVNAAWQIVHGILVFGRDFQVYHDGKLVSALDYLLEGGTLNGWQLRKGDHGLEAIVEPGSKTGQGHEDQWLGYLSQCGLSTDDKIVAGGQTYTVRDLVTQAQWDIYDGMEATWTLMGFGTLLPIDTTWKANDGSEWSLERIAGMEARQDLANSACGGSHRLYALSLAVNRRLAEGGKLTGGWKAANDKIQGAITKAKEYQQPDGSFSTNFFSRPGTSSDLTLRINTTGHTLEFLTLSLTDKQLAEPWVTRAVVQLLDLLERTKDLDLECGSLYHAVHALQLYRIRLDEIDKDATTTAHAREAAPKPSL